MQFYVQPVPHFSNFSLLMVLQASGLQLEVQSDLYYGRYYYHPRATPEHDIFYR